METTESVQELWNCRAEIAQPQKRPRLLRFYDVFLELIESVARGDEYQLEAMQRSPWWEHLRPKYRKWTERPVDQETITEMQAVFQTSIDLFHDIRNNGVRDPLVMYWQARQRRLILGYRRLVICHVLGIAMVSVLTHNDYAAYRTWRGR